MTSTDSRFTKSRLWMALAVSGLLTLGACGGSDDLPDPSGQADESLEVMAADLPPTLLLEASDESIVADARLGRLVYAGFDAPAQAGLDLIKRYFTQHAPLGNASDLRHGDVLVVDGSQVTAQDMGAADQLAARALSAQVPIIIVGFSDTLEDAVHKLLPTASVPGFNSLALVMPPRAGQAWNDGAIVMSASQAEDTTLTVSRNTLDQFASELLAFRQQRIGGQAALTNSADNKCQVDSGDPAGCNYVQQMPLGRLGITNDFSFRGLGSFSNCLSRDWQPYSTAENALHIWSRTYVGYTTNGVSEYFQPQCPSQVWNFFPVLYLTFAVDTATNKLTRASRVLYLGMSAELNPHTADKNSSVMGWYQTRHSLEVLPDPAFVSGDDNYASPPRHGMTWIANTPKTQNNQTTQSDTAGWSLNGQALGGAAGGKPTGTVQFGWSVNFSHTTTNTIPDWKLLDNTDPTAGIWRFDFQQASVYPVDDSNGATCANMGDFLFTWAGKHCHSLPRHVITDKIKDLSTNTASVEGVMVWDLGSDNNHHETMKLQVNTKSWFDSAGCARLTKKSKQSFPGNDLAPPNYLKGADCSGNQSLAPYQGTWYQRALRGFSHPLTINLDLLEIPELTPE